MEYDDLKDHCEGFKESCDEDDAIATSLRSNLVYKVEELQVDLRLWNRVGTIVEIARLLVVVENFSQFTMVDQGRIEVAIPLKLWRYIIDAYPSENHPNYEEKEVDDRLDHELLLFLIAA